MKKFFYFIFTVLCFSFFLNNETALGQTTYTSTGNGAWTTMLWSPPGVPGPNDTVIIRSGDTVYFNSTTDTTIAKLQIGQGYLPKALFFMDSTTVRTLRVTGDIVLTDSSQFNYYYQSILTNLEHNLRVGGNIIVGKASRMNIGNGSTRGVNIYFNKPTLGDQFFYTTGKPDTVTLSKLILNRTAPSDRVVLSVSGNIKGANNAIQIPNPGGVLEFNSGHVILPGPASSLTNLYFVFPNGTLKCSGDSKVWFTSSITGAGGSNGYQGHFVMNTTDTVVIGSATTNTLGGQQRIQISAGTMTLTSGTMVVNGRMTLTTGTVIINGANIDIYQNRGAKLATTSNAFEVAATASLTFSSGRVLLPDVNQGDDTRTGRDIRIRNTPNIDLTGSTFIFGDGINTSTNAGTGWIIAIDSVNAALHNLTLNGGGVPGRNILLRSNIIVNNILKMQSGTLNLGTQTLTYGPNAILEYAGSSAQVPGAELQPSLPGLTISNPVQVTLNQPVVVNGPFSLTNSTSKLVTDNTNILNISATGYNGTILGYVDGPMIKDFASTSEYIFPTGKGSKKLYCGVTPADANPLKIFAELVNSGFPGLYTVDTPVTRVNNLDYFNIDRMIGTSNAKIRLFWDASHNVYNLNNVRVIRNTGSNWDNCGVTAVAGTTAAGSVTSDYISSFSPFTIGHADPKVNLTALIEGLYDPGSNTMVQDTVKVFLCNTTAPYAPIDSALVYINLLGYGEPIFPKASDGASYYLKVTHRNGLETWSTAPQTFSAYTMPYDFTTSANKAYGDNLVLKGTKWCIYSGDPNHDGQISLDDLLMIDTDNQNFEVGYLVTDVNGDGQVTLDDLLITDSNNQNFVSVQKPGGFLRKSDNPSDYGIQLLKKIDDYRKQKENSKTE